MNPNSANKLQSMSKFFEEYEAESLADAKARMQLENDAQMIFSNLMVRLGVIK